jgi:predicted Zn-dependent protease
MDTMRKRVFVLLVTLIAISAVGSATFLATQRVRRGGRSTRAKAGQKGRRSTPAVTRGLRAPDPNLAPQPAVDDALYANAEFFGAQSSVARPYATALQRVDALVTRYPRDPRLKLRAARLATRLGEFDVAASRMVEYADLKKRSPDALQRLAAFYDARASYAEEVKTLLELARTLRVSERGVVYKQAADLVRTRALKEFNPADFFAELVRADPSNIQPIRDYVEELRLAKRYREALEVLGSYQPRFGGELRYFLKTRAQILESAGDRRGAEAVYSTSFDATWPGAIAADYYDLLRRLGRYRLARRGLVERVRAGATDLDTNGRLFSIFAYEGNYEAAARLLATLETRRAGAGETPTSGTSVQGSAWPDAELETVATMYASIGHYDQASRYLYTQYLRGALAAGSDRKEHALYRLFEAMIDAASAPTRIAGGDLSFYRDVAQVDQHPGIMNGVLSLILSGADAAKEFSTEERSAAGYFNRVFAYRVFTGFKQEFPGSAHLGEMYLGVVGVFATLGEHKLAIEAGREFQQRYPDSPEYASVGLRMADSYVALNDRKGERAVLAELLDRFAASQPPGFPLVPVSSKHWSYGLTPRIEQLVDRIRYNIEAYSDNATFDPSSDSSSTDEYEGGDDDEEDNREGAAVGIQMIGGHRQGGRTSDYSAILERYVSSLAAEDKKTETVRFFWGEIKKHPGEEGLYERFLAWLGQAQLLNEQLKAYNSAIRRFDSNTWYQRLARWYVRQKRGRELTRYSQQLIDVFDEDEITDYLIRFAGYGATSSGDELNWDERLAFDLYSYAHKKFPRNLLFVRGMLTYLEKNDRPRWERLSTEYYFADRSIREDYIAWLSKQDQLRERYGRAMREAGASKEGPYAIFAADASLWLSHPDEALETYRGLARQYPGEPQYAGRLADLTRSFGQQSDAMFEESARVLAGMADIYPANHDYRIKAGEVYAELGDFGKASEQWDRLIKLEPGNRATYLEVATVYWDYYQFDNAIRVFKELRRTSGDPGIYAYRMGAVYEGKGDVDSAITEYVKVLPEAGDGRMTVAKRLAQLSRRTGLADKIEAAYRKARTDHPGDWNLVLGYAAYLSERGMQTDAVALLRREVEESSDIGFLESVRDLFRQALRPDDERLALERLVSSARDERESMMYRLRLAAHLERHGQADDALKVIDNLVAAYPSNVGVVEESAQFYWRAGLVDRSLDLYRKTIAQARGINLRSFTLQLARREIDAGRLSDAESTLRGYYDQNRSDTEAFGELARVLGAENKLDELAALYQDAFKEARATGAGTEEGKERIAGLRTGMIRTLDSLGKHQDALDQHIEIINAFPEDADKLAQAMTYAQQHNLVDRLVGYYQKLSKESFRNYRWQLVLGRIYERLGNLAGASDQYKEAVLNEPQRSDLRLALASTLSRQRRYDEAIKVLRDGWALAGRDQSWLVEVARIQVRQGLRDEAVQTIRQALDAKKNRTANDEFQVASQLAEWGLNRESVRLYEETFARLPKTLKDEYVDPGSIAAYVRVLVRVEAPAGAFQKIERLRAQYSAIAANSQDADSYRARSIVYSLDQSMRADFGKGVIDYATPGQQADLGSALRAVIAPLTAYDDREEALRYIGIARASGLVDVEEQLYTQVKDAAFKARTRADDTRCYNELRALTAFYERHAAFTRAAEVLAGEYQRDRYKDRFDYQNQIAAQYRLAGDTPRELDALRTAYAGLSGSLTTSNLDWADRYFTLLYDSNARNEITRLAGTYNPQQLQLINFLVSKSEESLARTAIASSKQSQAWIASRTGEIGLFLKDTSVDPESFFREALGIAPIGEMIGRKLDTSKTLVGDDWFTASRNFGYWLGMVGREADGRKAVLAEIEGHPSSARAQLELAAYYLDRKNTARATEHLSLAEELATGNTDVATVRGAIALAKGDRNGAIEAWAAILRARATPADAQRYLTVMSDHGLFLEALPALERFIVSYGNRGRVTGRADRIESLKPLIREIAGRGSLDARLAAETATMFQAAVNGLPDDLQLARMIVEESLLPESVISVFYRAVHQRLSDAADAVVGTSEYEDGYLSGGGYIYPARELAEWRKRFVDYLIRNGSNSEAVLLIATIKKEQSELALATEPNQDYEGSSGEDRYDWLPLASALLELRSTRADRDQGKALTELRRYCGLDASDQKAPEPAQGDGAFRERCLKAYALLLAEHREADAEALLYEFYRRAVTSRSPDDASLVGLAEAEARRGQRDEATRLLKFMAERSTENLKALGLAASTAGRIGLYENAIDFREQIARINPDDATNKVELVRVIASSGKTSDAIDRAIGLLGDRATPNSAKAQVAEVLGQLVAADKSQAAPVTSSAARLAQGSPEAGLLSGIISIATGRTEEGRQMLLRVKGPLEPVAQLEAGLVSLGAGRSAEAAGAFERALYLDADGTLASSVFFRALEPRVQLILTYGRIGRDAAALRLAESDGDTGRSFISAQVRSALAGVGERAESSGEFVFEPPLQSPPESTATLRTLAELNSETASRAEHELLPVLAESAARLGRFDRAIAIARLRAADAKKAEEKAAAEKRLDEMIVADRARKAAEAARLRIDRSNATGSIYATRLLGQD